LKLKKSQIIGFIFTSVIGSILHFTYDWSGNNLIVGIFSAVNESTWEHLKLFFVPMLIFGTAEYFVYGKKLVNFIQVRFLSILIGLAIIIVGFYTYSGLIGKNYLAVDILLFIAAVFAAYCASYKLFRTGRYSSPHAKGLALLGFVFLLACMVLFTFAPPHIQLFLDPVTGTYGVPLK